VPGRGSCPWRACSLVGPLPGGRTDHGQRRVFLLVRALGGLWRPCAPKTQPVEQAPHLGVWCPAALLSPEKTHLVVFRSALHALGPVKGQIIEFYLYKSPVIGTGWRLLPQVPPECRTTHSKNLCQLGSYSITFFDIHDRVVKGRYRLCV
jgi:hypothetical protein